MCSPVIDHASKQMLMYAVGIPCTDRQPIDDQTIQTTPEGSRYIKWRPTWGFGPILEAQVDGLARTAEPRRLGRKRSKYTVMRRRQRQQRRRDV